MAEAEYKLKGKGLFVIIKQVAHRLHYLINWAEKPTLDYDSDADRLLKVFNLKDGESYNLKMGKNLTNTNLVGASTTNSFDDFMDEVKAYDKKPSFVMFFLMSHGFNDGVFLLSTNPEETAVLGQCCEGREKHTHKEACHTRKLVDHVIEPVATKFPDIPKIFIIQTCRGSSTSAPERGAGDPPSESSVDLHPGQLFLPRYPHTLVYRACIEGNLSWVGVQQENRQPSPGNEGSLLLRNFCDVLESLDKPMKQHETFISQLYTKTINADGANHNGERQLLELNRHFESDLGCESMVGGWMADVLDRTTGKVSSDLVELTYYYSNGSSESRAHDKQQPHINSTLPYSLSYVKMFKTQWY